MKKSIRQSEYLKMEINLWITQTNRYASYVYYHSITIHWSYSSSILSTYSLHMSKHFHARINPSFTIVKFILLDMLKKEYMYTSIIIVYTAVFEVSVFYQIYAMHDGRLSWFDVMYWIYLKLVSLFLICIH